MTDRIGEAPDDLAPREEWIINTCREFKLPIRSADEDFFEAGGTSLTLMRIIARAEGEFGVTLDPEDLLEAGTVRAIAAVLDRSVGG
jgi:acyl carrier protein